VGWGVGNGVVLLGISVAGSGKVAAGSRVGVWVGAEVKAGVCTAGCRVQADDQKNSNSASNSPNGLT
jgi:hypothetical protein